MLQEARTVEFGMKAILMRCMNATFIADLVHELLHEAQDEVSHLVIVVVQIEAVATVVRANGGCLIRISNAKMAIELDRTE